MKSDQYEPPIFSIYFDEEHYYKGKLPWFHNPADYDWVPRIEAQWKVIRDEITSYLDSGKELDNYMTPLSPGQSKPGGWTKLYFLNWLMINYKNCRSFPETWKILSQIPGLTTAGMLALEPGTGVLAHSSTSNLNIRCQMGIVIPAPYPTCGMRVGDEKIGWEEGKVLMFSDCHNHEVWNNSDQRRIVIAFDILNPEYDARRKWRSAQYLSALSILFIDTKIPFIKKTPNSLLWVVHNAIAVVWRMFYPLQAFIGLFRKLPK